MKLNIGLDIPVQLVRMSLKTVHNKKMLTIKGKKCHVTNDFYLMIIKALLSDMGVEKVNRSSSKRPKKLVGRHISFCQLTLLQDEKSRKLQHLDILEAEGMEPGEVLVWRWRIGGRKE